MNKFKTRTLLASALLGLTVSAGPAQADLFAIAVFEVDNFLIYGGTDPNTVLDFNTDFADLSFTSSADMDGFLSSAGTFGFNEPNGDDIGFPSSCLSSTGDCTPLTEDGFEYYTGPQGLDYVAADQLQEGSPIQNLPFNFQPGFFDLGANVGNIALGSLSDTVATGSANVNNALEASWEFTLAGAGALTFEGDFRHYLEAFASAGELAPGKAAAATEFNITITDLGSGLIVYDAALADPANFGVFTDSTAANPNDFGVDIQTCGKIAAILGCGNGVLAGSFSLTTGVLDEGVLYQLALRQNTNIDIARVEGPEPSILALLGLGFLGISLARRRRG